MTRPELLADVGVVLAALVGVTDQQRDRGAGGQALVYAGEDLDLIGLSPRRGVPALAGSATLQVVGEFGRVQRQPRRAAIDHAADSRPVRLAERGDGEQLAERIGAHGRCAASSVMRALWAISSRHSRSEEHTSELQSQSNLVCRLLLEKKKKKKKK